MLHVVHVFSSPIKILSFLNFIFLHSCSPSAVSYVFCNSSIIISRSLTSFIFLNVLSFSPCSHISFYHDSLHFHILIFCLKALTDDLWHSSNVVTEDLASMKLCWWLRRACLYCQITNNSTCTLRRETEYLPEWFHDVIRILHYRHFTKIL